MNKDYIYCADEDICIHRRGCKRWVGNYPNEEVKDFYTKNRFVDEIDITKCIPNYKDKDCENNFQHLDRFRLSDGSPFKKDAFV